MMKTALRLIGKEQTKFKNGINYHGSDIGHDLLTIQKGVRYAIDNNDPRLKELLVKAAGLIASEIDRLNNEPIKIDNHDHPQH